MLKRAKIAVAVLAVSGSLLAGAVPALASDGCPPPPKPCENPRGEINGWEFCGDGCCKVPRGQINGWEKCGSGDCMNPRGAHNGWEPCSGDD